MATDLYRVDSYHFNVGQGDGAIHILCKLVTGKKPTVERAVLCDGGDGGKHLTNLQKFIYTDYAVIYDIPTKGVPLKFDSIIITHWDDDHCNGIVDLIKKDWEAFFNTKRKPINDKAVAPGPVDTVTEDISQAYNPAFKELPTDTDAEKEQKTGLKKQAMKWLGQIDYYLQEWQCGFLKYDAGACTTHLYAPDWADSEGQDKTVYLNRFEPKKHYLYPPGTDAVDPNYDDKIKRLKTDGTTTPPRRSWSRSNQLVEGVKGTDGTWMNVLLKTTIKGPPRAKMPFTTSKDSHWDLPVYTYKKKFCKLRYTVGECIGVDFFTNESLPSATPYTAVADVTQLIDAHKANASTYPVGCYCLGQGRYAIGVADNIDEVMDAFPDGWRGLDGGDERVIDEKNDKRNWQSTVAIVLWKDTKRVSHYFAGDADFEKELFATKWVLGDGSTKRDGEPLVPCMKISHHGSHSSTPIPILRTFQPHYLIASLGDSNTYFHPRE
ncbi:hypothetical protein DFH27DRAFT_44001 [Peziza echinospora]|nr:hypothetical protein DFH27DRAFT_44001 [Peziza echinospora]